MILFMTQNEDTFAAHRLLPPELTYHDPYLFMNVGPSGRIDIGMEMRRKGLKRLIPRPDLSEGEIVKRPTRHGDRSSVAGLRLCVSGPPGKLQKTAPNRGKFPGKKGGSNIFGELALAQVLDVT